MMAEPTTSATVEQPPPDKPAPCNVPTIEPKGNQQKSRFTATTIGVKNPTLNLADLPSIDEFNMKICEECGREFLRAYLYKNFALEVCDDCREPRGVHELITRTDAKNKYLLKDCDLDKRKPVLRYVLKKNPYANRGDMRLYLKLQIESRAVMVHGSEEKLMELLEDREAKRTVKKQKVYHQKMEDLNKQVRSSLFRRKTSEYHEHDFAEPICIDNDKFKKECKICGHCIEYEEM